MILTPSCVKCQSLYFVIFFFQSLSEFQNLSEPKFALAPLPATLTQAELSSVPHGGSREVPLGSKYWGAVSLALDSRLLVRLRADPGDSITRISSAE